MTDISFAVQTDWLWLALLVLVPSGWFLYRQHRKNNFFWPDVLLLLMLLLLLFKPSLRYFQEIEKKPILIVLQDKSTSVLGNRLLPGFDGVPDTLAIEEDIEYKKFVFGNGLLPVEKNGAVGKKDRTETKRASETSDNKASAESNNKTKLDVLSGRSLAYDAIHQLRENFAGRKGAILLIGDGMYKKDRRYVKNGLPLFAIKPPGKERYTNNAVLALHTEKDWIRGEKHRIRVRTRNRTAGQLELRVNGKRIASRKLAVGPNVAVIDYTPQKSGDLVLEAALLDNSDSFSVDDQLRRIVTVEKRYKQVLVAYGRPHPEIHFLKRFFRSYRYFRIRDLKLQEYSREDTKSRKRGGNPVLREDTDLLIFVAPGTSRNREKVEKLLREARTRKAAVLYMYTGDLETETYLSEALGIRKATASQGRFSPELLRDAQNPEKNDSGSPAQIVMDYRLADPELPKNRKLLLTGSEDSPLAAVWTFEGLRIGAVLAGPVWKQDFVHLGYSIESDFLQRLYSALAHELLYERQKGIRIYLRQNFWLPGEQIVVKSANVPADAQLVLRSGQEELSPVYSEQKGKRSAEFVFRSYKYGVFTVYLEQGKEKRSLGRKIVIAPDAGERVLAPATGMEELKRMTARMGGRVLDNPGEDMLRELVADRVSTVRNEKELPLGSSSLYAFLMLLVFAVRIILHRTGYYDRK